MNVVQLIEERGGAAAVATAIGKKPGAVRTWKSRKRIPREAWPEVLKAYPDLTLDDLVRSEAA